MIQKRLQVKNTEMKATSVSKVQFANLNDNRYYFFRQNCFFTVGHPLLSDLRELKKSFLKIHTVMEKKQQQIIKNGKSNCCKK